MSEETPINYKDWCENIEIDICNNLCEADPFWNPNTCCYEWSEWTRVLQNYYTDYGQKVRWDRIHGWKRKVLKTEIHNQKMRYKRQADVFNKYVGRKDIMYIHARIGGGNWPHYYKEVVDKDWFIEKVDDGFDSTYCDIYAKIKEI